MQLSTHLDTEIDLEWTVFNIIDAIDYLEQHQCQLSGDMKQTLKQAIQQLRDLVHTPWVTPPALRPVCISR